MRVILHKETKGSVFKVFKCLRCEAEIIGQSRGMSSWIQDNASSNIDIIIFVVPRHTWGITLKYGLERKGVKAWAGFSSLKIGSRGGLL
jgi:hypothetical protein